MAALERFTTEPRRRRARRRRESRANARVTESDGLPPEAAAAAQGGAHSPLRGSVALSFSRLASLAKRNWRARQDSNL